jgi:hypothetical protein
MSDDVIKNPRRFPKTPTPYEPEHVRKGINVPEVPVHKIEPTTEEMLVSVDGTGLDSEGKEIPFENGHVIDNNDYVNLGYNSIPNRPQPKGQEPELEENAAAPRVGDYILMVLGKLITSGSINKIETRVRSIMYGDDKSFNGIEVSMDDIVVLKRVDIKVGIFVDG